MKDATERTLRALAVATDRTMELLARLTPQQRLLIRAHFLDHVTLNPERSFDQASVRMIELHEELDRIVDPHRSIENA